jgi:hypothetical protein
MYSPIRSDHSFSSFDYFARWRGIILMSTARMSVVASGL